MDPAAVETRLEDVTRALGIADLLERQPHQLSIGEKKKVALAGVLVLDPEVVLLDEPTAGIDPLTTRHIIDMLCGAAAGGKTIVTATHDLHIVEEMADTVVVLGRERTIRRVGRPSEILGDEQLLWENNLIHVHRHRHAGRVHEHVHLHSHDHHA
jgi:cobalt/nickel transport system ATP-binding protein